MTGVILAGSTPWIDDPLAAVRPRGLLPVANRALLVRTLEWFRRQRVHVVVICVNNDAEAVIRFVEECGFSDLQLLYYVDRVPRGPAGCVRDAGSLAPAETYLVIEHSVVPLADIADAIEAHRGDEAAVTILAEARSSDDAERGIAAPAGVYIMSDAALAAVSDASYQDIKEMMFTRLLQASEALSIHHAIGATLRVRDLASYVAAQSAALRAGQPHWVGDDYVRRGAAWIHRTARVDASARLAGDVMIGPGSTIADDCVLIGPVVVGARSTVETASILSRSVLLPDCRIAAGAQLDFSVLAEGARIRAGARRFAEVVES